MAYTARTVKYIHPNRENITNAMPAKLHLKFAKPPCCRSLACEAWFYEPEIRESEATATAQCYGSFATNLPSGEPIVGP
jgi:hypothetical protein